MGAADDRQEGNLVLKVIGIGGGGINELDAMIESGIAGGENMTINDFDTVSRIMLERLREEVEVITGVEVSEEITEEIATIIATGVPW